jgi:hypothetical protein
MENLINDFIQRLDNIKAEEKTRILQYKKLGVGDSACILTGKIMAIDYCINELNRIIAYSRQSESNQ